MKKILLLLTSVALLTACGEEQKQTKLEQTRTKEVVYICTGGYSKRYHESKECRGLCNCGGIIKEISLEKAESMGRTPCQICY